MSTGIRIGAARRTITTPLGLPHCSLAKAVRSAELLTLLGWPRIQTGDDRAALDDFARSIHADKRYGLAYADRGVAEADLRVRSRDATSRALHLNGQDAGRSISAATITTSQ